MLGCGTAPAQTGDAPRSAGQLQIVPASDLGAGEREEFAPIALRGYGTVSGTQTRFSVNGGRAASLQIVCESPEKAKLLHAKFISDLGLMPGVEAKKLKMAGGDVAAWSVAEQGWVCAIVSGGEVVILSASKQPLLNSLYASIQGDRAGFAYEPQTQVPMYLDRWDRFGFRAYNQVFNTPSDKTEQTYDYTAGLEFQEKNGRVGAVIVTAVSSVDTAEGLVRFPSWDWYAIAARDKLLPLGLNLNFGPQTWLANRYRDQMAQKMPQYVGGFYRVSSTGYPGGLGGEGWLSWSATTAEDEALADVQQIVKRFNDFPNMTTWLEPHGELRHGDHDIFLEYGPVADVTFRAFLKEKYGTPEAVSSRWGDADVKSWDDVKVPEIATFFGWGPQAIDLTGEWKMIIQDAPAAPKSGGKAQPYPPFNPNWFSVKFDDSKAPTIVAPGNDRSMFLPRRPAVYRRHFDVDAAWRNQHDRVILYVWDLNGQLYGSLNDKTDVIVHLNGKRVSRTPVFRAPHWVGIDVSSDLLAGGNDLAIGLPQGYMGYRIYLSPDAPAQYPNLGKEMNARWADFADWQAYTRLHSFRRGAEMIREVDPNRQIIFMSPSPYYSAIKELCEDFGGEFHDTGGMAGSWQDVNTLYSSGSDLPSSVEPGSPADNVKDYRLFMARWMTEGVQGIDYFIHLGNLMWDPEIRKEFESTQNMVQLVGKYNVPKAETAILMSDRAQYLTLFPWGGEPNPQSPDSTRIEGYDRWSVRQYLMPLFRRDGISDGDFRRGNAAKYRVILDANTAIMDDDLVNDVEKYVRDGGIFVAFVQTGRSTSTDFNSWPISRLTGYEVTHIDPHDGGGTVTSWRELAPAPGQTIFAEDYWTKNTQKANGLSLRKVADDAQDLMLWKDGSVAVGMRPLGKGFIINVGAKFSNDRLTNDGAEQTTRLFSDILDHYKIPRIPASAKDVMMRHFVSNNGLYDVWLLANFAEKQVTTNLVFTGGLNPVGCIEVQTGKPVTIDREGNQIRLKNLKLDGGTMRAFLTPRNRIDAAPRDWFALQRNWWRGATKPSRSVPAPQMKLARDLTDDWAFQPITDAKADVTAMTKADFDDSQWPRMRIGIWNFPDHLKVRRAVFRKTFTVPAEWTNGRVDLWYQSWTYMTFYDRGRVFVDGELVKDFSVDGVRGDDLGGKLQPGTTHTIAVEIDGKGVINGSCGDCWISFVPNAVATLDLAGEWTASPDAVHFDKKLTLPGRWDAYTAKRKVTIDAEQAADRNVILHIETDAPMVGVITNGHFIRRHHHMIGTRFDLNITPWIRPGQENELELVTWERAGQGTVKDVSLQFHDPAAYP